MRGCYMIWPALADLAGAGLLPVRAGWALRGAGGRGIARVIVERRGSRRRCHMCCRTSCQQWMKEEAKSCGRREIQRSMSSAGKGMTAEISAAGKCTRPS